MATTPQVWRHELQNACRQLLFELPTFFQRGALQFLNLTIQIHPRANLLSGSPPKSNQQAQVDMVDEVLRWAGVTKVKLMVDVGCGIGGSSRHIARKYGAEAKGITLSPKQAARANMLSAADGLASKCSFQVSGRVVQMKGSLAAEAH